MKKEILYRLSIFTILIFLVSENLRSSYIGSIAVALENAKAKYILLLLTVTLLALTNGNKIIKGKIFNNELKCFTIAIIPLIATSIYYQLDNGYYNNTITEYLYILTPFIFSLFVIKRLPDYAERFINSCFYITSFCFLFDSLDELSLSAIASINFAESYSPFENGLSYHFVLYELYYLFKNDKKKTFISIFFCILSLKRLCVLKAIVFYFIVKFSKNFHCNKTTYWTSIIICILIPIGLYLFYSGVGVGLLESLTNRDINEFTMDRFRRTQFVIFASNFKNYGLGTSTLIMEGYDTLNEYGIRNLHCDALRLLIEGTIITTIVFTTSYFRMIEKRNLFAFLLILNLFTEIAFNHVLLGAGVTNNMILVYMLLFIFNRPYYKVVNVKFLSNEKSIIHNR